MEKIIRILFTALCLFILAAAGQPARAGERVPPRLAQQAVDHYSGPEQSQADAQLNQPALPQAPDFVSIPSTLYVFQSYRASNWDIFSSAGSYELHARLTNDPGSDIMPRFNHNSTRIIFSSNRSGAYELYSMNPDGLGLERLTNTGTDNVNPDWSPDGAQIIFQSYRDGQAEIYSMNADGSNLVRLTDDNAYDGEPAWSPDGTQIAFTSTRYPAGIYTMNRDGSNLRLQTGLKYAENPTWSPDGSQIAFDADFDNDNFLEIGVLNYNAAQAVLLYEPGANTDAWVRSWSPDGRYIFFSGISFYDSNGVWYFNNAYAKHYDLSSGAAGIQFLDTTLLRPDIATAETALPAANLNPLPATSPSDFTISWIGDAGGSVGLLNFDIQVKDGPAGTWTDWRQSIGFNSSIFSGGVGGHTYYFRVRGRNLHHTAGGWSDGTTFTQIESAAPLASIQVPQTLNKNALVYWSAADSGGSGGLTYDVQYRNTASPTWRGWLTGTQQTEARFNAPVWSDYEFRVQATDRAHNTGAWQVSPTPTRLCTWGLQGELKNYEGNPVSGAQVSLASAASIYTGEIVTETVTTGPNGAYSFCANTPSATYRLSWTRSGYGSLPAATYPQTRVGPAVNVLPPLINLVQGGDFEKGLAGWQPGGDIPAVISNKQYASGGHSAVLGQENQTVLSNPQILDSGIYAAAMSKEGVLHVVRADFSYDATIFNLYYQYILPSGEWSTAELIEPYFKYIMKLGLSIDDSGQLNLVMQACPSSTDCNVYFKQCTSQGIWRPLEMIGKINNLGMLSITTTLNGDIAIATSPEMGYLGRTQIKYRRTNQNFWSFVNLVQEGINFRVAADSLGRLNILTSEGQPSGGLRVKFYQQAPNHIWAAPYQFDTYGYSFFSHTPKMAVDAQGRITAAFMLPSENTCVAEQDTAGVWSFFYQNCFYSYLGDIKTDLLGNSYLFLISKFKPGSLEMATRPVGGNWSAPVEIFAYGNTMVQSVTAAVGTDGRLHVTALYANAGKLLLFYLQRSAAGVWMPAETVNEALNYHNTRSIALLLDAEQQPHITWISDYKLQHASQGTYIQNKTSNLATEWFQVQPETRLSFLYNIQGDPNRTAAGGMIPPAPAKFSVQVEGLGLTPIFTATATTDGWQQASIDLSPWTGQFVKIHFRLEQIKGLPVSWAYIDDISMGRSGSDMWVSSATNAALPGSQVVYSLNYGNQGGALAQGVVISHTLPAGLTFVAGSLPVTPTLPLTGTFQTLTWNLGSLPSGASGTIQITATVGSQVSLGATLLGLLEIYGPTFDLETDNNLTPTQMFIGHRVFLPVVFRK